MNRHFAKLVVRIGAAGLGSVFQAASLLILARDAGPSVFGVFGQVTASGYLLGALLSFGLSVRALRLSADGSWKPLAMSMYLLRFATSAIVALVLVGAYGGLVGDRMDVVASAAIFVTSELLSELTQGVLSGKHQQNLASFVLVSQRSITFLLVLLTPIPTWSVWDHMAAGSALSLLIALAMVWRVWSYPTGLSRLLRSSIGYWYPSLASNIGQLDVLIIRFVGGNPAAGLYAAGSRLGTPLNLVTNAMLNVFVPTMSSELDRSVRDQTFRTLRKFSILYAVALTLAAPFIAGLLVAFLGEGFRDGWLIYTSIIVGAAMSGISQTFQALVFAEGRPSAAGRFILIGGVVGLVALFVGGSFGVNGLAAGPVAGQAVILTLFVIDRNSQNRA